VAALGQGLHIWLYSHCGDSAAAHLVCQGAGRPTRTWEVNVGTQAHTGARPEHERASNSAGAAPWQNSPRWSYR